MSIQKVTIRNENGDEAQVVPTTVPTWEANGWTVVDDESKTSEPVRPSWQAPSRPTTSGNVEE